MVVTTTSTRRARSAFVLLQVDAPVRPRANSKNKNLLFRRIRIRPQRRPAIIIILIIFLPRPLRLLPQVLTFWRNPRPPSGVSVAILGVMLSRRHSR